MHRYAKAVYFGQPGENLCMTPDKTSFVALPADFRAARDAVDLLVHGVRDRSWTASTPCPDWTVRDLVGHLVDGQNLVCRLADGMEWATEPDPGHLAGDDPAGAWSSAVAQVDGRLDTTALSTMVATPTGEAQLGEFLDQRVSMELLVHAWDLARATGQHVSVAPTLPGRIHAIIAPLDEYIRGPRRYGPRQHTSSSDELDQLVAFLGRTV